MPLIPTSNSMFSLNLSHSPFQDPDIGSIDPQLERQVETIRNLVESYFGIVSKTIRDSVPKCIMFMMVNQLQEYMTSDLLPTIYSAGDQDSLMEESQEASRRREEMVNMYHTCKDALNLISDVSTKTGERWALFGTTRAWVVVETVLPTHGYPVWWEW